MTQRFSSGGPYERRFGYSRAVAADGHLWVSGCTSVVDGDVAGDGDARRQARVALDNALTAVTQAGFSAADVVRTRMYVVDLPSNGETVAEVHGEVFADVLPASALIGVAALVDPRMLVEIELEAYRAESPGDGQ
jgi:enamine deaminase RidA (YjgF/YER057c/UK114 family)